MTQNHIPALWIVQRNLGNNGELVAALDREKIRHLDVDVVPFSDDIPNIDYQGPVVCYGATGFIARVARAGRWQPATFYDPATFRYTEYLAHWGDRMLNSDARVTTIGGFGQESHLPDRLFYVRPVADLKEFAGDVIEFGKLREWFSNISAGEYTLKPDCQIIVAEPTVIRAEYRLFMLDGQCIAASQYKLNGRLASREGCRLDFVLAAEKAAREWSPSPVFVMDVCEARPDEFKIVEANCFNSAGFYKADMDCIVAEVSRFVEHAHGKNC